MSEPPSVYKAYTSAFLLDKAKIDRILDIAEQRLAEANAPFSPIFDVTLKNGRSFRVDSSEELFGLDNTVRNPIASLSLEATPATQPPTFRIYCGFNSDPFYNVRLDASAPDRKWAAQTFAELEEQVDRTLLRSFVYKYLKSTESLLSLIFFIVLAVVAGILAIGLRTSTHSLSPSEARNLVSIGEKANGTEARLDFLTKATLMQLRHTANRSPLQLSFWRLSFLLLPVILLASVALYNVAVCYPRFVFAWGDYEAHHNSLVFRRHVLWTVVGAALVIGIVGNLFVASLPSVR